jgi:hypothetical protein
MMNERIIELRKEAYNLIQTDLQTNERDEVVDNREHLKMVFDKFAELIVKECIDVHKDDYGVDIIGDVLKKHFGVE